MPNSNYLYFKEYYKMIAKDLSKQQERGADRKAIQESNFCGSLDQDGNRTMFFIIEKGK